VVGLFNCTTNIDYLGTLTGRIGFTFDQFLIYGKGGAAVERAHFGMIPSPRNGISNVFGGAATQYGWEAGGGVEFAFSPALSAFAEYDFFDFGSRGISLVDQNGISAGTIKSQSVQLLKIGLNYKVGQTLAPWAAGLAALPAWPTPTAASFNWTGVYVGGQVGNGWGRTNWNSSTGFLGSNASDVFAGTATANGFAIGGQVGANYQIGALVTGVEADVAWADLDSNAVCSTPQMGFNFTCHTRIDTLGTLAGRLGFAFGNSPSSSSAHSD
jgi:opacity protein-like surface antigen